MCGFGPYVCGSLCSNKVEMVTTMTMKSTIFWNVGFTLFISQLISAESATIRRKICNLKVIIRAMHVCHHYNGNLPKLDMKRVKIYRAFHNVLHDYKHL